MRYLTLILFLSLSCSGEKKTNVIQVEISPAKLLVDQKHIRKSDFEKELKTIVETKKDLGFNRDELVINLQVDTATRRGDIADIETVMRRWNVRRINYSTLKKSKDTP